MVLMLQRKIICLSFRSFRSSLKKSCLPSSQHATTPLLCKCYHILKDTQHWIHYMRVSLALLFPSQDPSFDWQLSVWPNPLLKFSFYSKLTDICITINKQKFHHYITIRKTTTKIFLKNGVYVRTTCI